MKELINLHLGQCGLQVGSKFWELISCEHGINSEGIFCGESAHQLQRINVYFDEGCYGKYCPRAILVDLETSVLDSIRCKPYGGSFFRPDYFINGERGGGNNWAKGYYGEGSFLAYRVMDTIRKSAEVCDSLQGFQITHCLGGGTGSGLGSLLISKLRDEYPDEVICTHTVMPSKKVSDVVTEPYNTMLSMNYLVEYGDLTVTVDNEALFDICIKILKMLQPTYSELNHLIGNTLAGITAGFRFPGQLNTDLRKLCTNMVPFPRLHNVVPSFAPLVSQLDSAFHSTSLVQLIEQLFHPQSLMAAIDNRDGYIFTMGTVFRGRISTRTIEEHLATFRSKNKSYFTHWIPNAIQSAICDIPSPGYNTCATMMANSSAIKKLYCRYCSQFSTLMKRKAFVHWYLSEGMEDDDFLAAIDNISYLIKEYEMYETDNPHDENDHSGDELEM